MVAGGTTRMAFFPYGELRRGISTEVQYATCKPYGAVTHYGYDPNNVAQTTARTDTRIVRTTLDGLGRPIRVETGESSR